MDDPQGDFPYSGTFRKHFEVAEKPSPLGTLMFGLGFLDTAKQLSREIPLWAHP